jgi:hypothetical protein
MTEFASGVLIRGSFYCLKASDRVGIPQDQTTHPLLSKDVHSVMRCLIQVKSLRRFTPQEELWFKRGEATSSVVCGSLERGSMGAKGQSNMMNLLEKTLCKEEKKR